MKKLDNINELNAIVDSALNDHFELDLIFKNCSISTLEEFINYYLIEISNMTNKVIDIKICDSILEHFDYNFNVSDLESRKRNYSIMEEANIICDDLIKKICNTNNRTISLPISIKNLVDYSISSYISNKDINKLLYFITVKLSIIYNFYK